ncbi:hypothetical protein BJ508DRAFT_379346 [Ascobolus immersus RN42]|uniref:Uncharacterized protein n=1 Tax=Ascobolus immersus RN42 TaxID=1160509 RepID=A0A3N4HXG7_ASCIM|nr:hypothetical protein BJ508DRAFT_379346 [Ascobolus immersus RN42]
MSTPIEYLSLDFMNDFLVCMYELLHDIFRNPSATQSSIGLFNAFPGQFGTSILGPGDILAIASTISGIALSVLLLENTQYDFRKSVAPSHDHLPLIDERDPLEFGSDDLASFMLDMEYQWDDTMWKEESPALDLTPTGDPASTTTWTSDINLGLAPNPDGVNEDWFQLQTYVSFEDFEATTTASEPHALLAEVHAPTETDDICFESSTVWNSFGHDPYVGSGSLVPWASPAHNLRLDPKFEETDCQGSSNLLSVSSSSQYSMEYDRDPDAPSTPMTPPTITPTSTSSNYPASASPSFSTSPAQSPPEGDSNAIHPPQSRKRKRGTFYCPDEDCPRNVKPFSRTDNRDAHRRSVHGVALEKRKGGRPREKYLNVVM